MRIEEIIFDQDDKELFQIDDQQLKADAIRYSILPKLEIINNELIARLTKFYSFNFYENMSVAKSPHFRLSKNQRKEPTKTNYTCAGVSITGQRKDNKWKGLDKGNNIIPKISPTSLNIELSSEGLKTFFFFNHPKNFTKKTYKRFFAFFIKELNLIAGLMIKAGLQYDYFFTDVFTMDEDLELRFETENYDVLFISNNLEFPIDYHKINDILYANILMFPILNSCIEIALGKKPLLDQDILSLGKNILSYLEKYHPKIKDSDQVNNPGSEDLLLIKLRAESKIKVVAGIRWQVFARDNWKCVSCGRSPEHDIILHVDHIVPRSKGGKNEMDNYQTLCDNCNIGKSNNDDTDLRRN